MKQTHWPKIFLALAMSMGLVAKLTAQSLSSELNINDEELKRHIAVLANDSLTGRKPFSGGEIKTVRYIEKSFKDVGLQPGNHGSYFQLVPLVQVRSKPTALHIHSKAKSYSLIYKTDFVASTQREDKTVILNNSPLVFAGFGIVAPEYHWDDYKGIDVKGKTVIVLVNDPGFHSGNPRFFKGDTMTYYGRWTYKYEEAARHGAAGVLIVHETEPASYNWSVITNSFTGSKLYLQREDKHRSRCKMEGWLSREAAKQLLMMKGIDSNFRKIAATRGFKAMDLGAVLADTLANDVSYATSKNVIGMIRGASAPDESVVYTAHWDHLGVGEPVKGDSIYNGAIDNASGVAAIIAIAKAFHSLSEKPRRSVVFLAVTAEEQGLLGSEYYATHPVFAISKTAADINMDALGSYGSTKDVSIVGLGQSELDEVAKKEAAASGRYLTGDPNPGAGGYFRSDHFNFAKVGVPSLDLGEGLDSYLHGKEWGKAKQDEYNDTHYHQPSDEFSPDMDVSGMVQNARLLFEVGLVIAQGAYFPKWKPGSEFKGIREKSSR